MSRKLALVLVSSLALVGALFANAGPPPLPKGHKVAQPPVRFEGIDKHPDYIFHLYYYGGFLGRTLVEVKDANAIKLDFKTKERTPTVSYMALKAMERKEFDRRKQADAELKWFDDFKAEGVLAAKLTPPETTAPIAVKEIPVTTCRVTLKDGKLSAEKVEDKKRGGDGQAGLLPPWTFGILMSLSMTWFGIWLARRDSAAAKPGR
jgi:hypothetical protein